MAEVAERRRGPASMHGVAERRDGVSDLVALVGYQLERNGMDWDDFLAGWRELRRRRRGEGDSEEHWRRLEGAARAAIVEERAPEDRSAFREVVADVGELFGEPMSVRALDPALVRVGRLVRTVAAAVLFAFVLYMVLGGLATHETPLLGDGGAVSRFAVLAALLAVLGAFESLQVGVTTLRLKDLESVGERYPQARAEHRKFRDALGTNRFLAGRQVVVVIVVFVAARLTSFPDMETWPLTERGFPGFLEPWFEKVFLELGVLGALLVLWVGQLAPQFVTTKNPAAILNLPGMNLVLDSSFFIESVGLTRPADWLSFWYGEGPHILSSAEERYRLEVEATQGYGVVGITKHWHIGPESATLHFQNAITFRRGNVRAITDRSLLIRAGALRSSFSHELIPAGLDEARREIVVETELESSYDRSPEWTQVAYALSPAEGPFAEDEVLVNTAEVWYRSSEGDRIAVLRPTRYLLFRLTFEAGCRPEEVLVEIERGDESVVEDAGWTRAIPVVTLEDGTYAAEFFEPFPELDAWYSFRWRVAGAV